MELTEPIIPSTLDEAIKLSGKKKSYLADKLGITNTAFSLKLKGKRAFKGNEIFVLCDELGITDVKIGEQIFLP